jgi:hypothetical protein
MRGGFTIILFRQVMRTTRNQELDKLSGGQPLNYSIGKTRVRLGNLRADESAALLEQEKAMNTFVIVR